ncbi:MAG TPA: hypothetical protein DET40_04670 [Lentisphaeria bacterium]|nr:MAG: hypothetical protein A2X45_21455 [Lentisphaerae bacterium GWF2_50_93]HCE42818.1 hypothetical protein [Lentisphaeria bacterium]
MKKLTVMVVMVLAVGLMAADEKVKVPAELTTAQQAYRAQIEAATAQIKVKYQQKLEALKKTLGAQGRLEEAMQVQREITALTKVDDVELDVPANGKSRAIGKWQWGNSGVVELKADGTVAGRGVNGTWKTVNKKTVVKWNDGWTDTLTISDTDTSVTNNRGDKYSVSRVE